MIDVFVQMPGASARRSRSASPSRWRSCSGRSPASSTSTRRPAPGCRWPSCASTSAQDEEEAIVRLNQKMFANFDLIPPGVLAAADQAALDRRRADPGADVAQRAGTTISAAPRRGAGRRRDQAGAGRFRDDAHRRPAPAGARAARRGRSWPRIGVDPAAVGRRCSQRREPASCRPAASRADNREVLVETGEFLDGRRRRRRRGGRRVTSGKPGVSARRGRDPRRTGGAEPVRACSAGHAAIRRGRASPDRCRMQRASIPPSRSRSPSARGRTPSPSPSTCWRRWTR